MLICRRENIFILKCYNEGLNNKTVKLDKKYFYPIKNTFLLWAGADVKRTILIIIILLSLECNISL